MLWFLWWLPDFAEGSGNPGGFSSGFSNGFANTVSSGTSSVPSASTFFHRRRLR